MAFFNKNIKKINKKLDIMKMFDIIKV